MATHSGVLAWRIPGSGEPGGLQSMGSHRVGHDWSDLAATSVLHIRQESSAPSLLLLIPPYFGVSLYILGKSLLAVVLSSLSDHSRLVRWVMKGRWPPVYKLRDRDDGASWSPFGLLVQSSFLALCRATREGNAVLGASQTPARRSARTLLEPQKGCDVLRGVGWVSPRSLLVRKEVLEPGKPRFCHL